MGCDGDRARQRGYAGNRERGRRSKAIDTTAEGNRPLIALAVQHIGSSYTLVRHHDVLVPCIQLRLRAVEASRHDMLGL